MPTLSDFSVFNVQLYLMIRNFFVRIGQSVSKFFHQPLQVLIVCSLLVFFGLLLDGSLLRLWRLNRDSVELAHRITQLELESKVIDQKLLRTKDPAFIELEAREKLDLASEGDLVFVFSDDE